MSSKSIVPRSKLYATWQVLINLKYNELVNKKKQTSERAILVQKYSSFGVNDKFAPCVLSVIDTLVKFYRPTSQLFFSSSHLTWYYKSEICHHVGLLLVCLLGTLSRKNTKRISMKQSFVDHSKYWVISTT